MASKSQAELKPPPRAVKTIRDLILWEYHTMHRTLDRADLNKDGKLDLLDLGAVFQK